MPPRSWRRSTSCSPGRPTTTPIASATKSSQRPPARCHRFNLPTRRDRDADLHLSAARAPRPPTRSHRSARLECTCVGEDVVGDAARDMARWSRGRRCAASHRSTRSSSSRPACLRRSCTARVSSRASPSATQLGRQLGVDDHDQALVMGDGRARAAAWRGSRPRPLRVRRRPGATPPSARYSTSFARAAASTCLCCAAEARADPAAAVA